MKWVLLFRDPWFLLLTEYASNLIKDLMSKCPVHMKHLGQYPNMTDNGFLFLFFFTVHASTVFFSYKWKKKKAYSGAITNISISPCTLAKTQVFLSEY